MAHNSECEFVAFGIQHAMLMRRLFCHLWLVQLCNVFPRHLINGTTFEKVTEYEM
jgi:hypothetical protein